MRKLIVLIAILGVLKGARAYNVGYSRVRRQAEQNCQRDPIKFHCQTTADCIDSDKMCEGIEDCRDGSDERDIVRQRIPRIMAFPHKLLKYLGCPGDLFRCSSHVKCISPDQRCAGVQNYEDNSDKINCLKRLINKVNTKCRCDGVKNCADNSDEANCAPIVTTTTNPPVPTTPSNNYCSTPPHPENGQWKYLYNPYDAALPNVAAKPLTTIIFRCNKNYKLSTTTDEGQLVYCTDAGRWSSTVLPQCLRLCPKRVNKNHVTLECSLDRSKIGCDKATPGTRMTYQCDSFFESASAWNVNICGENGEWNYDDAKCQEICGEKRVSVEPLVIGGKNVNRGEYPWMVALYSNKKSFPNYTNICGGSLLSTSIVITAAHCVTIQDTGDWIDHKYYKVSAGKYYIHYGDSRDNDTAQYSSIRKIIKHEWYKGRIKNFRYDIALLKLETPFALSKVVQPVCLHTSDVTNPLLRHRNMAIVTGWGDTSTTGRPSDVLQVVELEYVDQSQCRSELDPSIAVQYFEDC